MFSNIKIGQRIAISLVLLLALTVAVLVSVFLSRFNNVIAEAEQRELRGLFNNISTAIASEAVMSERLSALVAGLPDVQQAMANGDRARLADLFVPGYANMKEHYDLRQFQFHQPPATSFLRVHEPAKFGDDLSSIRQTVVQVNTQHRPLNGIEAGVAGLGIRGVAPIQANGRHVGSVEFGLSFGQPFFESFKQRYNVDVAMMLRESSGQYSAFASTFSNSQLLSNTQREAAFSGQNVAIQTELDGRSVAVFAAPVKDFSGKPLGLLEIAMDRSYYANALSGARTSALIVATIALAVGLILATLIARSIVQPISAAAAAMRDIAAGEGDLTRRLPINGSDEVADLALAFNNFAEKVRMLVANVAGSTTQVASAAEEMSAITEELNRDLAKQRGEIEQVATAMNEMTATVQEVARHASQAARSAESTDQQAVQGQTVVGLTVSAIGAVASDVERATQVIARLQDDSKSISSVLEVIRGVAEQTNLLALNAAIEAARAGEQGRGFAVVADEVRTLASRTQQSTGEIQTVIEQLQSAASEAAAVMQQSQARAHDSVAQAQQASVALEQITLSVTSINDMNAQIASAAEEQSAVSDEINQNVVNINDVADRVTESAGQTAQASSQLARLAIDLQNLVGQFKYH
ncbi:MAG: methyl-accepting chemotaxis protein [Gammaproteobacteria bacterium]|nr:methyl-accepting chemotaxis protein [Gammaproteobacteria bacterium]MBU0884541.1 methyl-accepting chemotaxis protein [Gammaproteobacteria bacterium]MBU1860149.1 methyl-accepting chemotaxis protein [Gammaproteobacteria bacterium]